MTQQYEMKMFLCNICEYIEGDWTEAKEIRVTETLKKNEMLMND